MVWLDKLKALKWPHRNTYYSVPIFGRTGRFHWDLEYEDFRQGHASLYLDEDADNRLRLEWSLFHPGSLAGIALKLDDEDSFQLSGGAYPIYLYLTVSQARLDRLIRRFVPVITRRVVSFQVSHEGQDLFVHWTLWDDNHSWHSTTPRWRQGSFFVADKLFGREHISKTVLESREIEIPMPEGMYHGTAELSRMIRRRPRLLPAKSYTVCDITLKRPIPFPGKGENSYDCGEDAVFGTSVPARTIEEGIGALVGSVLRDRMRRGGAEWRPSSAPDRADPIADADSNCADNPLTWKNK